MEDQGGSAPQIPIYEGRINVVLEGLDEAESQIDRLKQKLDELRDGAANFSFGKADQEQSRPEPIMGQKYQDESGETKVRITSGTDKVEVARGVETSREMLEILRDIRDMMEAQQTTEQ